MDGFEAPSFSLGLDDEEIKPSPRVIHSSNPFKIDAYKNSCSSAYKNEADTQTLKSVGEPDYDSDFEVLSPSSTPKIMKRLQRKSGHSVLAPSNAPPKVHLGSGMKKGKEALSQNLSKSSNDKKTCLPEKVPTMTTAGSKGRTLPNFWKGLDCKSAKGSSALFCSNQNGVGSAGQYLNKPMETFARFDERKSGTSQVSKLGTPDVTVNGSTQHCKAGLGEGYTGPISAEKEDSGVALKCSSPRSLRRFTNDLLATGNDRPKPLVESGGKHLHDQRPSLSDNFITSGDNDVYTTPRKILDDNKSVSLDELLYSGNKEVPLQSSWRSLDHKKGNLHSPSPDGCVLNGGISVDLSQTIQSEQPVDCPTNLNPGKTNGSTSSQSKTSALQSFWKSLNEKKSSPSEADLGAEEDDIENCSIDDDFEFGTQSTKKLSLCGSSKLKRSHTLHSVAADLTPIRSFSEHFSSEIYGSPNKSFDFQYSPKSSAVDARENFGSTPRNATRLSSTKPGTGQSVAAKEADQILPPRYLNDFGAKQSISLDKPSEATSTKKVVWQCSEDAKEDNTFFPHAFEKNGATDQCRTPINAFQKNTHVFEGKDNFSADDIALHDPRVASLIQLRFPHFLSVTTLREGNFAGAEQVYVDYGNQFLGGKAVSGSTALKQQTTTKWRKLAQKNQKSALADNDGWIQTGNRKPAIRRKSNQSGGHRSSQAPAYTDATNSSAGPGYWVTERTGKRIYITKDGRKLSGSSAYKQHIKDNGKRVKKTKKRRPRPKKQRITM